MNRLTVLLAVTLLVCHSALGESTNNVATNDVVRLRLTVVDVVPLRGFSGALTPTKDLDPRFALTVRIDSCIPAITNLKSGTIVTFAVHSPSMFLGGSAKKGTTHEVTFPRKRAINLASAGLGSRNEVGGVGMLALQWQMACLGRRLTVCSAYKITSFTRADTSQLKMSQFRRQVGYATKGSSARQRGETRKRTSRYTGAMMAVSSPSGFRSPASSPITNVDP
jgi:hypothetical protein